MEHKETIHEIRHLIVSCEEDIYAVIQKIYLDRIQEATQIILKLFEELSTLLDILVEQFAVDIKSVQHKLVRITDALNNKDFVMIGDIMEYELLPVLLGIKDEMNSM